MEKIEEECDEHSEEASTCEDCVHMTNEEEEETHGVDYEATQVPANDEDIDSTRVEEDEEE